MLKTGKQMKYFVMIAMWLTLVGCERAMPNDVDLAGYNAPEIETLPVDGAGAAQEDGQSDVPTGAISNEQDFDAVATVQTVESDAERIAANRAKYIVMDVQALPMRTDKLPNVVEYAIRTKNLMGVQLYRRFGTELKTLSFGGCEKYSSTDAAQKAFLSRGGPERDVLGLDPDGDGFACHWDPRPFQAAVQN
jgi:hypothetical protein